MMFKLRSKCNLLSADNHIHLVVLFVLLSAVNYVTCIVRWPPAGSVGQNVPPYPYQYAAAAVSDDTNEYAPSEILRTGRTAPSMPIMIAAMGSENIPTVAEMEMADYQASGMTPVRRSFQTNDVNAPSVNFARRKGVFFVNNGDYDDSLAIESQEIPSKIAALLPGGGGTTQLSQEQLASLMAKMPSNLKGNLPAWASMIGSNTEVDEEEDEHLTTDHAATSTAAQDEILKHVTSAIKFDSSFYKKNATNEESANSSKKDKTSSSSSNKVTSRMPANPSGSQRQHNHQEQDSDNEDSYSDYSRDFPQFYHHTVAQKGSSPVQVQVTANDTASKQAVQKSSPQSTPVNDGKSNKLRGSPSSSKSSVSQNKQASDQSESKNGSGDSKNKIKEKDGKDKDKVSFKPVPGVILGDGWIPINAKYSQPTKSKVNFPPPGHPSIPQDFGFELAQMQPPPPAHRHPVTLPPPPFLGFRPPPPFRLPSFHSPRHHLPPPPQNMINEIGSHGHHHSMPPPPPPSPFSLFSLKYRPMPYHHPQPLMSHTHTPVEHGDSYMTHFPRGITMNGIGSSYSTQFDEVPSNGLTTTFELVPTVVETTQPTGEQKGSEETGEGTKEEGVVEPNKITLPEGYVPHDPFHPCCQLLEPNTGSHSFGHEQFLYPGQAMHQPFHHPHFPPPSHGGGPPPGAILIGDKPETAGSEKQGQGSQDSGVSASIGKDVAGPGNGYYCPYHGYYHPYPPPKSKFMGLFRPKPFLWG